MFMHACNCISSTWQNRRENVRTMTTHQPKHQAQSSARHLPPSPSVDMVFYARSRTHQHAHTHTHTNTHTHTQTHTHTHTRINMWQKSHCRPQAKCQLDSGTNVSSKCRTQEHIMSHVSNCHAVHGSESRQIYVSHGVCIESRHS